MRLWEKVRKLTVSDKLILPYGAKILGQVDKTEPLAEKNARDVFHCVGGVESLTAARTLKAADSGKILVLNLAAGFTTTLPAPEENLRFKFVVGTAPTGGNYVIATNGGANIIRVGINELEVDTGDDGPSDEDADTLNFVQNVALISDFVELFCDGTYWYGHGQTRADGGVTTSTT